MDVPFNSSPFYNRESPISCFIIESCTKFEPKRFLKQGFATKLEFKKSAILNFPSRIIDSRIPYARFSSVIPNYCFPKLILI